MSAARRRRRMEIKLQDGRIKAEAIKVTTGTAGAIYIGDDTKPIPVQAWTCETRRPIDQAAN